MKVLFAQFFDSQNTFARAHTAAIARYVRAKGHDVAFGGQYTDWSSFDVVYFDPGLIKDNSIWSEQVLMLLSSCAGMFAGQQRWVTNCDPVLSPRSLLLQLGCDDSSNREYTHVLRLPGQQTTLWPADNQFTKYAQYSAKLDNCQVITGDWWSYPDVQLLTRHRKLSGQLGYSLAYSGWPKGDRLQALTDIGSAPTLCDTYLDFAKLHGGSLGAVMLSSPGHCGATTLRLTELLALTVVVAGPGYQSNSYLPKFQVSNLAEANEVLEHLNGLTRQGRQCLLDEQLADLKQIQAKSKSIRYV